MGCDATPSMPAISLQEFVTATLPATSTPIATQTSLPPTTAPTISPITGTTTTEVNVRVDTSTASASLGTIPAFSTVQIIGKDISGIWFRILFSNDSGWVRVDYVQVTDATAEIPVWSAETGDGSAGRGVVLSGVNVRNGPGKDFESLGLLNQNDVVSILGKDPSGAWIKITYPASADGMGWVAAEYLQIDNMGSIPTLDEVVEIPAVHTPESSSPSPIQTILKDGDTADAPLETFTLSSTSVRMAQFQGVVSATDGEDWISFTSQSDDVAILVLCESGSITVELFKSITEPGIVKLGCGSIQRFHAAQGHAYLLRISPTSNSGQASVKYELKIMISE